MLTTIPWLILLLPLAAALGITLFTRRDRSLSAGLSIGAVSLSFTLALFYLLVTGGKPAQPEVAVDWLTVGELSIDLGLLFNPLSMLMTLIVTGVGGLIHIYSYGYMQEDRSLPRYFACLSFFTFSMLGIVLANNFVLMFVFWELVGVSSYLLIGFWYERAAAADAAKKAFLTNRLGDFGFLLGILILWSTLGSLSFLVLQERLASSPQALGSLSTIAGLLIFCGAVGKSAQFPLHVWLPDAMEGPTPVSALIHAATMVAAGVYMLCRVFFLFGINPAWPSSLAFLDGLSALDVIAWIGGLTALLAALIAVQQHDIKRILAYSTLSQLGYMIMAVGLHGPTPAMYHLTTHAFFKALLFLGAGSVLIALHHEQNIWEMGGLKQKMPVTYWTFLTGTLALSGVPPFSGFYSKDSLLATAAERNVALFIIGVLVAALTSFYMFRLIFVAFTGQERSQAASHAHESPPVMIWPLRILAVPSLLAGLWGLDYYLSTALPVSHEIHAGPWYAQILMPFSESPLAAIFGLLATATGLAAAWALYHRAAVDPLPQHFPVVSRTLRNGFYFDQFYAWLIGITQEAMAKLASWIDRWLIAGLMVRGSHGTTELFGRALRMVQTGSLQTYAFLLVLGVAIVLLLVLR